MKAKRWNLLICIIAVAAVVAVATTIFCVSCRKRDESTTTPRPTASP